MCERKVIYLPTTQMNVSRHFPIMWNTFHVWKPFYSQNITESNKGILNKEWCLINEVSVIFRLVFCNYNTVWNNRLLGRRIGKINFILFQYDIILFIINIVQRWQLNVHVQIQVVDSPVDLFKYCINMKKLPLEQYFNNSIY